jgi:TPP-dependent indolepyruvate ferredoxin oxidoreductase alpha subunit
LEHKKDRGNLRLLQGNIACALGALAAKVEFFGGYPITPSTEIAEYLARELPKQGWEIHPDGRRNRKYCRGDRSFSGGC